MQGSDAALGRLHEQACAAWPDFSIPRAELIAYVVERALPGQSIDELAGSIHAADLYLACACARGESRALQAFDAAYRGDIDRAFARIRPSGIGLDDAHQIMRQKLFVGSELRRPSILEYAGRGGLRAWLRMTAIRAFIDLAREHRDDRHEVSLEDALLGDVPAVGLTPERALVRGELRGELRAAFQDAVASLTARQRNLLRQHLVHELTIDQLAALYRAHRSTCARWLEAARDDLVRGVRKQLSSRLGVQLAQLDEIMQLVTTRLDITLSRVLESRPNPA